MTRHIHAEGHQATLGSAPNLLERRISTTGGLALAVTMVVGSGLFALPGLAIEKTDHITAFYARVTVACVVAPLVHIFAQLGTRFPDSAGIPGFAAESLGAWTEPGFTLVACGALAVGMPALFFAGGAYTAELFSLDPARFRMSFAIFIAAVTTLLNLSGVRNAALLNKGVVVIIVLFTLTLVVLKLPLLTHQGLQLTGDVLHHAPRLAGISSAATIIFWAFQGWENLSFGLREFSNPKRSIRLVYWGSFVVVTVVYLTFAWVVSAAHYAGIDVRGLSGLTVLLGSGRVRTLLLVVLVLMLITNANAWVFGASRAFYSAARSSLLPSFLGKINKRHIPANCLIASFLFYCVAIIVIDVGHIDIANAFELTTVGFAALYGAAILAYLAINYRSLRALICALLAAVGLAFLLWSFSWRFLYPTLLFFLGIAASRGVPGKIRKLASRESVASQDQNA